mgnify:CR=1 FL=1
MKLIEALADDVSLMDINPYVRFVNKIITGKDEIHACPMRQLYDYQLVCVLEGNLNFRIGEEVVELYSGDLIILPPFVWTYEFCKDNAFCKYYIAHFDFFYNKSRTGWQIEDMYLKFCRPWINRVEPDEKFIDKSDRNFGALKSFAVEKNVVTDKTIDLLQKMLDAYRSACRKERSGSEDLLLKSHMLKLFALLASPANGISTHNDAVNGFMDYVMANYNQKISITEFAKSCGYTVNHYRKIFKAETGETPLDYLLGVRLEKAKDFLLYNVPVNQTAERVGFDDPYYFSKVFKKETGVSPKNYKKTIEKMGW